MVQPSDAKHCLQMFDASLVIAKQTYSTKCYPDYDYEAEPYDCEKPCASTNYNVYGYTNEKGKPSVDVSAYFSVRHLMLKMICSLFNLSALPAPRFHNA